MNLFKHLKRYRVFSFNKTRIWVKENLYKTISDAEIISSANQIAFKNNCELISIKKDEYSAERFYIEIKCIHSDYINFCISFCNKFGCYINNINVY